MVVQAANRHALNRYDQFTSALELVRIALTEADPLIKSMGETAPRTDGWKVPAKSEVVAAKKKAQDLLDELRAKAKQYETQLIANGWRV